MTALQAGQVLAQVDTREQAPLDLAPLRMEQATLRTGDYTLAAAPEACVIERKTASDLLSCIGNGRERFEAELCRIRAFPVRVVLVECSWYELLHDERSKISATSISGTIASWVGKYAPFQFCGTRAMAQDFARRFLFNEARRLWSLSEAFRREVAQ